MTKKDYTHLIIVSDRSGSMQQIKSDAEGGINSFIEEQFDAPGKLTVTLVEFDTEYDVVKDFTTEEFTYTLVPRGGTALLDAIGNTINTQGAKLAKLSERSRPSQVIFVTVTDGYENSSKEFNVKTVKELIEHQREKYNWDFVFIGADEKSALTAQSYGFNTITSGYTGNTSGTYSTLSANINLARATGQAVSMPDVINP